MLIQPLRPCKPATLPFAGCSAPRNGPFPALNALAGTLGRSVSGRFWGVLVAFPGFGSEGGGATTRCRSAPIGCRGTGRAGTVFCSRAADCCVASFLGRVLKGGMPLCFRQPGGLGHLRLPRLKLPPRLAERRARPRDLDAVVPVRQLVGTRTCLDARRLRFATAPRWLSGCRRARRTTTSDTVTGSQMRTLGVSHRIKDGKRDPQSAAQVAAGNLPGVLRAWTVDELPGPSARHEELVSHRTRRTGADRRGSHVLA